MTWPGFASQVLEILAALLLAPLLTGWVNQCRAWLQNKSAPGLLQPYRLLHKLFNKDSVLAEHASPLFRSAPYIVFGCMTLASGIVPTLSTDLPLAPAADAIALVGLFALARVFISLAAMDVGTSFGTLGARREMLIGFLAEPALLMVLFSASLISKSTSLTTIVETLANRELGIYPSLAFAGVAFTMVALAVSINASSTPPMASLRTRTGSASTSSSGAWASATPQGRNRATPRHEYANSFRLAAHSSSARWRPEYSRISASWIIVSSRCVDGLSTGTRAFSASEIIANATPAKARLG